MIKSVMLIFSLASQVIQPGARVMNPGEAKGQLVYLTESDILGNSPKYKSLSPLSIPVFAELPLDLSVVGGAITLKQQNLLSHVQLKSRARHTPNLDISALPGGLASQLMKTFHDGDYVHMLLKEDGTVILENSTAAEATAFYELKKPAPVTLVADLSEKRILTTAELSAEDFDKVGSKAANYAELAKAINTPTRTYVRPGYAIPFYYYQAFMDRNPAISAAIQSMLRDPLMKRVADVSYREMKLKGIRDLFLSESNQIDPDTIARLIDLFDTVTAKDGKKRKMKLRSSTNSEDLPNFNGAGLYESAGYKPTKSGVELSRAEKEQVLKKTLRTVWASVWNTRAYEERAMFGIPHADVKMALQVNPSFEGEGADGVIVTKNIAQRPDLPGAGVFIEGQRGDKYSVANPEGGSHPEQILVNYDARNPLDRTKYVVHVIQRSNVSNDGQSVLPQANPTPVIGTENAKDLALQSLKATEHFKGIYGRGKPDFSLDLEFKISDYDTGKMDIFFKQARPYLN